MSPPNRIQVVDASTGSTRVTSRATARARAPAAPATPSRRATPAVGGAAAGRRERQQQTDQSGGQRYGRQQRAQQRGGVHRSPSGGSATAVAVVSPIAPATAGTGSSAWRSVSGTSSTAMLARIR